MQTIHWICTYLPDDKISLSSKLLSLPFCRGYCHDLLLFYYSYQQLLSHDYLHFLLSLVKSAEDNLSSIFPFQEHWPAICVPNFVFCFLILVPLTVLGRSVAPLTYFSQMSVCLYVNEPVLSWRRHLHMWFTPGQAFLHLGLEQLHFHVLNFCSPLVVLLYPDWDRIFYCELYSLNMYELWTVKDLYSLCTTFAPIHSPILGMFVHFTKFSDSTLKYRLHFVWFLFYGWRNIVIVH